MLPISENGSESCKNCNEIFESKDAERTQQIASQAPILRVELPKLKINFGAKRFTLRLLRAIDSEKIVHDIHKSVLFENTFRSAPLNKSRKRSLSNTSNSSFAKSCDSTKGKRSKQISKQLNSSGDSFKENCIKPKEHIGLENLGNTCFLNSILNVLRVTPGFVTAVHNLCMRINSKRNKIELNEQHKILIKSLHELFEALGNKLLSDASLRKKLENFVNSVRHKFAKGQQHDSHEFLHWIINELNTIASLLNPKSAQLWRSSIISKNACFDSIYGTMKQQTTCNECGTVSSTKDAFADIRIPLCLSKNESQNGQSNLLPTFDDWIHAPIHLKGENKFYCTNCSRLTNACLTSCIETFPGILILYIEKPIGRESRSKQKLFFEVPLEIEYTSPETSETSKYNLYAFVMHIGSSVNNAHYFSVVRNNKECKEENKRRKRCNCYNADIKADIEWVEVNDRKVSFLDVRQLKKFLAVQETYATPYLALYNKAK